MGFFTAAKVKINTTLRHAVLYPGNVLEGVVELRVDENIEFTAIRLKAVGKERARITREERFPDKDRINTSETSFMSCVVYKQLITLAGSMKTMPGGFRGQMPPGVYYYPFALQLPTSIPPSYCMLMHDERAEIFYNLKVYVDTPTGRDAVHRSHFTVVRPMPISQHAEMAPVHVDRVFDVTCCCCIDKGKVHAVMHMDRTLIAMGRDNLTVCCDIDNSLGKEPVESLEISLMARMTFTTGRFTEQKRLMMGKHIVQHEVPVGRKDRIVGVLPLNGSIVPSLTTILFQIDYQIEVELNIPWASGPVQTFNVAIVHSVDETDFSPRVFWKESKYVRFGKGQYTGPEMYYQPPSQPVDQCNTIPLPPNGIREPT